jgi:uncharacterized protein YbjT (DUF2867 family)
MILITGSTGKTGGEVARQLAAARTPFRALVRDADKAEPVRALGAELIVGDMADKACLEQALQGVDKALLVLPNIEQQLIYEKQFTDAAVSSGVRHLVYLSSLESVPESKNPITQNHVAAENYIKQSGLTWTMIRPTFFMQIFGGMAAKIKETGKIIMPAGNGTVSTTDLRDVGEIIRNILTGDSSNYDNQSYDLTGPQLLTFSEIADRFSKVLGKPIQYVDQPMDEFRRALRSVNLSKWRTDAVVKELEAIGNGAVDHTTDTIEKLLGRPPLSLDRYIDDHRTLFI